MKRRDFIQISSLSLAALLVDGCNTTREYNVEFLNDMAVGHLAFESNQFPITKNLHTKFLIVGGGIAGMTAAFQLRNKDFLLFELSNLLGGSSAGSNYQDVPLCHGAHYDLSYPSYYGQETLSMLEELKIIGFSEFSNSWNFVDKKYLIPKNIESQTFALDTFRKDVLPDGSAKIEFIELMKSFSGKMPMPTRLIDSNLYYLNDITFLEWLKQKISLNQAFIEGLDYHMKDDYGAGTDQVSALAGIHYFACRPYYSKPVELFSPPEGNSYFINKIYDQLPTEHVFTSHLVKRILETEGGFDVDVVDAVRREVIKVACDKIIYAGHKHSLKFIFPRDYHLFHKTQYAPWVVVNIIIKKPWVKEAFWQNEILSDDTSLLGFVDSKAQFSNNEQNRVFTVYFCFKPEEREMMSLIEDRKHVFIAQVLSHLEKYFNKAIENQIEKVVIKQMGHAMPIPIQGYLFNDANDLRSNKNLVYAGVDNGRLPLLFEAIDSGISAIEVLEG